MRTLDILNNEFEGVTEEQLKLCLYLVKFNPLQLRIVCI